MTAVLGAVLVISAVAAPLARADSGQGTVGSWSLVWRITETDEGTNLFRQTVGPGPVFPFRARLVDRIEGRRIVLFDDDGSIDGEIALAADERAAVAEDGSAYLVWRPEPLRARHFEYRFHRVDNPEPVWDAVAPGEPAFFAPDGSLFAIAAPDTAVDRFQRAWLAPGGRVQIVGASGDIRGEMPILPAYVRMTGDGRRIAMLHREELVVLGRDGVLDWSAAVPIDALVPREGHSQLEAAGGRIVVSGTGQLPPERSRGLGLHGSRRGTLRVFSDDGRPLWKIDQEDEHSLWFQISLALSDDGETLATFHSTGREILVRVFEGATGQTLWQTAAPRQHGTSCLSVSPDGQWIVLTHGDLRTGVEAWNREGDRVWHGEIPYPARVVRMGANGLLVADRWIVRLEPETE